MCSCFTPSASGYREGAIANKLGDHLLSGPHEVLPFRLWLRRLVCDDVIIVGQQFPDTHHHRLIAKVIVTRMFLQVIAALEFFPAHFLRE